MAQKVKELPKFLCAIGTGQYGRIFVASESFNTLEEAFKYFDTVKPGEQMQISFGKKWIYTHIKKNEENKPYSCGVFSRAKMDYRDRFFKKFIVIRPDGKARVNESWRKVRDFWTESLQIDGTVFAHGIEIISPEYAGKFAEKREEISLNRRILRDV